MNLKKVFFSYVILFSFSVYSFGLFFQQNDEQPMFEYKPLIGSRQSFSRKTVEELMTPRPWIITGVLTNVPILCAVFFLLPRPIKNEGFLGILSFNIGVFCVVLKFRHDAGKWLHELKEKELSVQKNQKGDSREF